MVVEGDGAEQVAVVGVDDHRREVGPDLTAGGRHPVKVAPVLLAVGVRDPGPAGDLGVLDGVDDRRDVGFGDQPQVHDAVA